MLSGRANALLQAEPLEDVSIVGINSIVEIVAHKCPPLMSYHVRLVAVKSVEWVDEVLAAEPCDVRPGFLDKLLHWQRRRLHRARRTRPVECGDHGAGPLTGC